MYDSVINTDRPYVFNRPDIVVRDKHMKKCYIIDVSCPNDINVSQKEQKITKQAGLRMELGRMWDCECVYCYWWTWSGIREFRKVLIVQSLKGIKKKISANLGQSVKICIRGQFFVLNKTRWGTRLIFQCTPLKNTFFYQKNTLKLR